MKLEITKQHKQTINIPVPCFWKSYYRYVGLISENQLVTFADYGNKADVSMMLVPDPGNIWLEATQEGDNFTLITEEEFFEAYDVAMKTITVTPILKTW